MIGHFPLQKINSHIVSFLCTRYPVLTIKVTKINFYTIYRKSNFEISISFKEACHPVHDTNFHNICNRPQFQKKLKGAMPCNVRK